MTEAGLKVLAVDDERPALDELAYLLREQPRVGQVLTASDAAGALRILEDEAVDAVFLDIRMPRLTGLDLAKIFARFAAPPQLVFVTAYDEHAVTAFDLKALDYVMKPVRVERLAEAVRRVEDAVHGVEAGRKVPAPADETIAVELAGTVRFVQRSAVRYVEAAGDYARLHTASGSHLVRTPLATLEEQWEAAGFVRVHRSYLVNLSHIDELHLDGGHYAVRMAGTDRRLLPVSRRHGRELRDRLVRGARTAPSS
jgi:DNA-binding LytR/AlgR family response regulator